MSFARKPFQVRGSRNAITQFSVALSVITDISVALSPSLFLGTLEGRALTREIFDWGPRVSMAATQASSWAAAMRIAIS